MILFICLLPMAFTNLKMGIRRNISCSDVSEGGGGAADAKDFISILEKRKPLIIEDTLAGYLENTLYWKLRLQTRLRFPLVHRVENFGTRQMNCRLPVHCGAGHSAAA
jgi:hypothetical protein